MSWTPRRPPGTAAITNGTAIAHSISLMKLATLPMLLKNCAKPCSGTASRIDTNAVSTLSRMIPPAMPSIAEIAAVAVATTVSTTSAIPPIR